jgi:hypothetical protein
MEQIQQKCTGCGGSDFLLGQLYQRRAFRPLRGFWWRGFAVRSNLCRTCGLLSDFVGQADLTYLTEKLNGKREPS